MLAGERQTHNEVIGIDKISKEIHLIETKSNYEYLSLLRTNLTLATFPYKHKILKSLSQFIFSWFKPYAIMTAPCWFPPGGDIGPPGPKPGPRAAPGGGGPSLP